MFHVEQNLLVPIAIFQNSLGTLSMSNEKKEPAVLLTKLCPRKKNTRGGMLAIPSKVDPSKDIPKLTYLYESL